MNSNEELSKNVKALDFVSCYYDNYWCIGLVLGKDDHQEDSRIKFMHRDGMHEFRARTLVVSDLRSETKGSRFESGCQLCAEVSSLQ